MTSRRQPRRRGATDFELNPRHLGPWIDAIGKFILNFGGLELQTHLWIDVMAKDDALPTVAVDMLFSRRIQLIVDLVQREDLPQALKRSAISTWKRASKLSELRNTLAHNPIIWGWRGPKKNRPPDYIGIPNIKHLKRDPKHVPYKRLPDVRKGVDEIVDVVRKLEQFLTEVRRRLHPDGSHSAPAAS